MNIIILIIPGDWSSPRCRPIVMDQYIYLFKRKPVLTFTGPIFSRAVEASATLLMSGLLMNQSNRCTEKKCRVGWVLLQLTTCLPFPPNTNNFWAGVLTRQSHVDQVSKTGMDEFVSATARQCNDRAQNPNSTTWQENCSEIDPVQLTQQQHGWPRKSPSSSLSGEQNFVWAPLDDDGGIHIWYTVKWLPKQTNLNISVHWEVRRRRKGV